MNCSTCSASHQLSYTCQQCYSTKQQKTSTTIAQLCLPQKQHQLQQKLKQINIQKLQQLKQAYRKQEKAKKIKNKIAQIKQQIVKQQIRQEKLMKIQKWYEQNLVIEELDVHEKYIEGLKKRNKEILDKVNNEKKRNKQFVEMIMKIFSSQQRRYKVMKYFRFQQNQNVIFTLQDSNFGIPVLKATNQQTIKYQPIQNKTYIKKEDEKNLTQTLKISHKLLVLVHKYFLYHIKLPYKMFFHRQFCFLANTFIKFDNQLIDLSSPQLVDFVNMLQANLEFLAYAVGGKDKPFVILNKVFLEEFQKGGFCKNRHGHSRWDSFLKYLKPAQIMNHYEEQEHASQVIVIGMEKDSDQQFEILE